VYLIDIQVSPQALLLPGVQCLQQPTTGGEVGGGTKTVGGTKMVGCTKTVGICVTVGGRRVFVGFKVGRSVGRRVAVRDGVRDGVDISVSVNVGDAVSMTRKVGVSAIGVKVAVSTGFIVFVSAGGAVSMMTGTGGLVGSRAGTVGEVHPIIKEQKSDAMMSFIQAPIPRYLIFR